MRYSFGATSAVTERMFRLLVHHVTLLYGNSINKIFISSTFLKFRCSYMSIKVRLLKNIVIDLFVILLACINLAHSYSTLFFNGRQLSISLSISATSAMTFLSPTSSLVWPLLPSLNLIYLNPLWVDWIHNLDSEVVLYTLSYTTLSAMSTSSPPIASILQTLFIDLSSLSE